MVWIDTHWQRKTLLSHLLAPLSWLYCLLMQIRTWLYRGGLLPRIKFPVPVIIVGNLTVGGTGKTPLVIWLAQWLQQRGLRPGIVSRGYGGKPRPWSQSVHADSDPGQVGDEPLLLVRHTACPVLVDSKRTRAARNLLTLHHCDIIISDDGLQHLALQRDIEIVVIDGLRRFGNGRCLPAGPLRESRSRLKNIDLIIVNGAAQPGEAGVQLSPGQFINIVQQDKHVDAETFADTAVHAVAGIGNPQRFFDTLQELGLKLNTHAYVDHHPFVLQDISFDDKYPVIMTEKDAVKCEHIIASMGQGADNYWYLAVEAKPDNAFITELQQRLKECECG